jgi:uncharacterized protein involved in exopolysaccharide biosynthesis
MTVVPQRSAVGTPGQGDTDGISLVAVVNLVLRNRYLIVGISGLLLLLTVGTLLLAPRTYTAESSFMLQSRPQIPASLSGLAAQFGFTLPSGDANQSPTFYADLLQSREVLSAVAESRFTLTRAGATQEKELADWLRVKPDSQEVRRDNAIRRLEKLVDVVTTSRTGVITLKVQTQFASLSRQINQRMLTWLNEFNLLKRQSQAAAEREFTEARLKEAQQQLRDAENQLLAFTQRNREIRNSPLLTLEQDRMSREVSMRQQVYTSVAQAYDRAKIEEVRNTPVITILLPPEEPVRPDSRRVAVKAVLAMLFGFGCGVFAAFWRESGLAGQGNTSDELAEFARYRHLVGQDFRHPLRTAGRVARLGRSRSRADPGP